MAEHSVPTKAVYAYLIKAIIKIISQVRLIYLRYTNLQIGKEVGEDLKIKLKTSTLIYVL